MRKIRYSNFLSDELGKMSGDLFFISLKSAINDKTYAHEKYYSTSFYLIFSQYL